MDIYGTIGPACDKWQVLKEMFELGMTGVRLNLSHTTLINAADQISELHKAAKACGKTAQLLVDMQGPELRIGKLEKPLVLREGEEYKGIPFPKCLEEQVKEGAELLMDDGKIAGFVLSTGEKGITVKIHRGGVLNGGKSVAVVGQTVDGPAVTQQDFENLCHAKEFGVTGIMQPFVRSAEDLRQVRQAMKDAGCDDIRLFAKIENMEGVRNLESFFAYADEIVIARGDLGNAMPLWELPRVQKEIEAVCRKAEKPFMVVTQMLASMEHRAVPTRAEVSDIYNAVLDGASSVMVTGETAVGDYPAEVIRYLANTAMEAMKVIP